MCTIMCPRFFFFLTQNVTASTAAAWSHNISANTDL